SPVLAPALADAAAQFAALVYPGFVSATGLARLPDLARYLRAIGRRLEGAAGGPRPGAAPRAGRHRGAGAPPPARAEPPPAPPAVEQLPPARRADSDVHAVRWMIEELRVSLFAQMLGTSGPVSEKRIQAALARLADAR